VRYKEAHLTTASIPIVRCLREMKASTNKISRDTTYITTEQITTVNGIQSFALKVEVDGTRRIKNQGNQKGNASKNRPKTPATEELHHWKER